MLPKHYSHIHSIHFDSLFCFLIINQTKLSHFLPLLSLSLSVFVFPPPLFLLPSLYSSLSCFLLTVSRSPALNSLSNPLTSGSIVCPLIITYQLPSAHSYTTGVRYRTPVNFHSFHCQFLFWIPFWLVDCSEVQFARINPY